MEVDYGRGSGNFEHEIYPLDNIEAGFITDHLVHLLRGLL